MKLNNKGFAITAVLYGLLILFVILVSSYLLVLSAKKDRIDDLVKDIEENYSNSLKTINLVEYIRNLYSSNNPTQITQYGEDETTEVAKYYYSTSVSLMNDGLDSTEDFITDATVLTNGTQGNIRYYGANPDNYIYFNCDDYNKQSASTCEKWRIIGIVDGKVKIIREELLERYSWDYTKGDGTYEEEICENGRVFVGDSKPGSHDNNWHDATGMAILNDGYINNKNEVIFYHIYPTLGDLSCNETGYPMVFREDSSEINFGTNNIGIKNDKTKEMISESIWYLGGHDSSKIYPNDIYRYERGNEIGANESKTWEGKIGLMYLSDYGYASDLSRCNKTLYNYSEGYCKETDWLFYESSLVAYNSSRQWLITPNSSETSYAWIVDSDGSVYDEPLYFAYEVRPVLYLNPEIVVVSGDGSSSNPYQIMTS